MIETKSREKKPYGVDKGKIVPGKKSCDRCSQKNPPIFECSWPCSRKAGSAGYFMDCCQTCVDLMSDHVAKGKTLGPFGELT